MNTVTDVCIKNVFWKTEIPVNQFIDESVENVAYDIFMLNVNFSEHVERDNDVFTIKPEIMPEISNSLPDDETNEDDYNESSSNE